MHFQRTQENVTKKTTNSYTLTSTWTKTAWEAEWTGRNRDHFVRLNQLGSSGICVYIIPNRIIRCICPVVTIWSAVLWPCRRFQIRDCRASGMFVLRISRLVLETAYEINQWCKTDSVYLYNQLHATQTCQLMSIASTHNSPVIITLNPMSRSNQNGARSRTSRTMTSGGTRRVNRDPAEDLLSKLWQIVAHVEGQHQVLKILETVQLLLFLHSRLFPKHCAWSTDMGLQMKWSHLFLSGSFFFNCGWVCYRQIQHTCMKRNVCFEPLYCWSSNSPFSAAESRPALGCVRISWLITLENLFEDWGSCNKFTELANKAMLNLPPLSMQIFLSTNSRNTFTPLKETYPSSF